MEKKTQTIGVMGAGAGCGVTHFTILFANYLTAVEGKKTAVLEWDGGHGLEALAAVCTGREGMGKPVSIMEVDYFPAGGADELAWCMQKGYECILLDFGSVHNGNKTKFLQCGQQFFFGALNEWKLKELLNQREWMEKGKGHWTFLAVFGGREARRELKRRFGLSFEPVPFAPDVFSIEQETAMFFKKIGKGW